MAPITLTSTYTPNETTIPNIFLDRYMPSANGEFVKVYLCLLRMYANPAGRSSTLTDIADLLNHTESDIIRAIKYWEKAGLLSVGYSGDIPVSITLLPIRQKPDRLSTDSPAEEPSPQKESTPLANRRLSMPLMRLFPANTIIHLRPSSACATVMTTSIS